MQAGKKGSSNLGSLFAFGFKPKDMSVCRPGMRQLCLVGDEFWQVRLTSSDRCRLH